MNLYELPLNTVGIIDNLYCNDICFEKSLPICVICGKRMSSWLEGDKGIQQAAAGQQQAKAQQPGDELFHLRPSTVRP